MIKTVLLLEDSKTQQILFKTYFKERFKNVNLIICESLSDFSEKRWAADFWVLDINLKGFTNGSITLIEKLDQPKPYCFWTIAPEKYPHIKNMFEKSELNKIFTLIESINTKVKI